MKGHCIYLPPNKLCVFSAPPVSTNISESRFSPPGLFAAFESKHFCFWDRVWYNTLNNSTRSPLTVGGGGVWSQSCLHKTDIYNFLYCHREPQQNRGQLNDRILRRNGERIAKYITSRKTRSITMARSEWDDRNEKFTALSHLTAKRVVH